MSTCKFKTVKRYWFYLPSALFYKIIPLLGDSVLSGRFELGDKSLDVSSVDTEFEEFRSDEDFILYDRHEF